MKHLFIPYELAKLAKEKGFSEDCMGRYENQDKKLIIDYNNRELTDEQKKKPTLHSMGSNNNNLPQYLTSAPLYQQIVDWFREEKQILIHQVLGFHNNHWCFKIQKWSDKKVGNIDTIQEGSYYEAFNKAIEEAFKLI